jgi:DNA polymerase III epsilon subunit-like protein
MYLFFDTETTGLPRSWKAPLSDANNWPRLVQLAFITYDDWGNKIAEGNSIVKPEGYKIPYEASKIHGITTEKALQEGKPVEEVLQQFQSYLNESPILVAHNIEFDKAIVGAEFVRNRMENLIVGKRQICTMKKTVHFCAIPSNSGYTDYKWPRLSELHHKLFRSDFEEAHNAAVDIQITAKCFWELRRIGKI